MNNRTKQNTQRKQVIHEALVTMTYDLQSVHGIWIKEG